MLICLCSLVAGGAYRPPHARGTLTPTLFKREDEGGLAYVPNGAGAYAITNGRTSPTFGTRNRRAIPGAATPGGVVVELDADGKPRRKKKENGKRKGGEESSAPASGATTPLPEYIPAPAIAGVATAAEVALSESDKKRRALMKKLSAIDQLKVKQNNGDKLELTQIKKLDRCARSFFLF